jgi:hypothetical protein
MNQVPSDAPRNSTKTALDKIQPKTRRTFFTNADLGDRSNCGNAVDVANVEDGEASLEPKENGGPVPFDNLLQIKEPKSALWYTTRDAFSFQEMLGRSDSAELIPLICKE